MKLEKNNNNYSNIQQLQDYFIKFKISQNQKFKNFEHLIIDNDSKDGTKKLVKKKINKKIRIISEKR